ncbi:SH3 domain-binding glutamic acid-rich-like protein 3 [Geranomyces variabilis]|nr:SH3 domain-binding glutamic acid-rich-like protein 3 [Geranomyces variabilis]
MPARVIIYYSSVSGSMPVKKAQTRVQDILAARKVEFELVDVAADEDAKDYMQSKSDKNALPQIFVDGEFVGLHAELEEANEDGKVAEWLGL